MRSQAMVANRRLQRLRGRGSLALGTVAGTEVFLPLLDWLVTFVVMFVLFFVLTTVDRNLGRQNLLMVAGFLGVAVMIQSFLYVLGSIVAAKLVGLRIAAVQLGPIRRMGRFVAYRDRGRRFFFFYALRSLPIILVWQICNAVWSSGGGPGFALIGQVCMLSVAFALLPTPGSDGQRVVQSLLWWLTGSIGRAAWWSLWICGIASLLLLWFVTGQLTSGGDNGVLWLLADFYLGVGLLTYLGSIATASRTRALDRIPLEAVARPVALAYPGARRDQYPLNQVGMVVSDGTLLGAVDDLSVGQDPVAAHMLPCPAAPVSVDPRQPFAETYLGLVDEGCDVVMLGAGDRYAALTLQDCVAVLQANGLVTADNHLGMP